MLKEVYGLRLFTVEGVCVNIQMIPVRSIGKAELTGSVRLIIESGGYA
jgi:hypothetical protein